MVGDVIHWVLKIVLCMGNAVVEPLSQLHGDSCLWYSSQIPVLKLNVCNLVHSFHGTK